MASQSTLIWQRLCLPDVVRDPLLCDDDDDEDDLPNDEKP